MAPIAKNEIQLRFENLADLYDKETTGTYFTSWPSALPLAKKPMVATLSSTILVSLKCQSQVN